MPFDGLRNSALVRTVADMLEALPDLFRKEIRLAQAEFTEKIKDGVKASAWMIVAGLLGFVTFFIFFRPPFSQSRALEWRFIGLLDRRCPGWRIRRRGFPLRPLHHAEYARTDQQCPGSQ